MQQVVTLALDPDRPEVAPTVRVRQTIADFLGWSDVLPALGPGEVTPAGLPENACSRSPVRGSAGGGHVGRVTLADYDTPAGRRVCFQFRLDQPPDPLVLRTIRSVTVPRIQRLQVGPVCWTNPEV